MIFYYTRRGVVRIAYFVSLLLLRHVNQNYIRDAIANFEATEFEQRPVVRKFAQETIRGHAEGFNIVNCDWIRMNLCWNNWSLLLLPELQMRIHLVSQSHCCVYLLIPIVFLFVEYRLSAFHCSFFKSYK